MTPEDPPGNGYGAAPMDPEVRRRVSLAVRAGEAVTDPAYAQAAVELARLAHAADTRTLPRRLHQRLCLSSGCRVASR